MKREDEELCKAEFSRFLERHFPSHRFGWEEVPPKDERPDYYLTINSSRYAVEVTRLHDVLDIQPKRFSAATATNASERFVRNLETKARMAGILNGSYGITASPIDHFADESKAIERRALYYISATRVEQTAAPQELYRQGSQWWSIQKVHGEKDIIYFGFDFGVRWRIEVEERLRSLIEDRMAEKAKKLEAIREPKILILLDRYGWGDQKAWRAATPDDISPFHTVFRASADGSSFILYSSNREWASQ